MTRARSFGSLASLASLAPLAALAAALTGACGSKGSSPAPAPVDLDTFVTVPESCAYTCPPSACPEATAPYACPNLGAWKDIPHDDACPAWDGTYPAPRPGQCTASAPTGDAAKYAGADGAAVILPDGRRIRPAGSDWVFGETDLTGGLTSAVLHVPKTSFVLTVDTGYGVHAVRVVDVARIGAGDPVVSRVAFAPPFTLNSGLVFIAPDLVYVTTGEGVVQALKLDTTSGQLTRDDARRLTLDPATDANGKPAKWYASGVAASPDGKILVVAPVLQKTLFVFDVAAGSPTFGKKLGQVDLPGSDAYGAYFDPKDGGHAYVSMWAGRAVVEVDVSSPAAPKVARSFATDKDPQHVVFLDARWMAVGNDLGDSLSLVDRASGAVRSLPIEAGGLYGVEPSSLAWDAPRRRLYATLAGINALAAYDVDLGKDPPAITPAGRLGTGWWPSGVAALDDGTLAVTALRGHGSGPRPLHFAIDDNDTADRMRGSIQRIPPDIALAAAGDAEVQANDAVGALAGHPTVTCPAGVSDFPVPATNTEGPSKAIDHVFFIVRENKGFDGIFGDFPSAEGRADLVFKTGPGEMDVIWQNIRTLARTFAMSDNYYTDAVYSTQGHNWTTYGRATDFDERTWATSGDGHGGRPVPGGGVIDVGMPVEGSLFDWLLSNGIQYDLLGEIVGNPRKTDPAHPSIDVRYPGGPFQNIFYSDLHKACYTAGRVRARCNTASFVYMTISNDHSRGVHPGTPTPETYCAVNDEATGTIIDAISHSPLWKSSLILITEDDPSQGGEHIDSHRAPFVVVSPWVKRGYVSKTHIDAASAHKIFSHVFGKPYLNRTIANAGLPLDLFTSTPDFTPYTYKPRGWPLACGGGATLGEKTLTESWDLTDADEQPGLDAQVTRWMRGVQFEKLPPQLKARVEQRAELRALGKD